MRKTWAVIALAALAAGACGKSSTGPDSQKTDELVGTWVSTGTNVPLGLRALKVKAITATFNANNTYSVLSTDSSNNVTTMTGTWSAGAITTSGVIRAITVNQGSPTTLTSQGIFQVTGTGMRYEVIQVQPALQGWTAPTITGGFGSTAYNGTAYAIYVQTYVKQ